VKAKRIFFSIAESRKTKSLGSKMLAFQNYRAPLFESSGPPFTRISARAAVRNSKLSLSCVNDTRFFATTDEVNGTVHHPLSYERKNYSFTEQAASMSLRLPCSSSFRVYCQADFSWLFITASDTQYSNLARDEAVGFIKKSPRKNQANDPQQSWGFDGEPPKAVIEAGATRSVTALAASLAS
jgi:hypothetical protein